MHKRERFFACALLLTAALFTSAALWAQSPFDGTWHTNLAQAKLSPKPNVFYLSQELYHCVSCVPAVDAKADGTDQPVTGQPYDTISVKEVDAKTLSVTTKKAGTVVSEQTRSVSADGKTLTVKTTYHPKNGGAPVVTDTTATLVGAAPSGVHATSGTWRIVKIKQSDNALDVTYKTSGDQFTMTAPTGETYTAAFDGKDYPVTGAYSYNTVSLKRIDKNTIEETHKRDGVVTFVDTITVSPDGKKLTEVSTSKLTGRVDTYIATKK